MTQGVLVKLQQDCHDLKVLWDSTFTFIWLMKLISASFLFGCGDYYLFLLKHLPPVYVVSALWNEWCGTWRDTLKLLDSFSYCRSQQPNVYLSWPEGRCGNATAQTVQLLYYPSEAALNDSVFIFKPNNVSQSILNRSSSLPCSVSQRWIMGIILILLNQVESLRYIQT